MHQALLAARDLPAEHLPPEGLLPLQFQQHSGRQRGRGLPVRSAELPRRLRTDWVSIFGQNICALLQSLLSC